MADIENAVDRPPVLEIDYGANYENTRDITEYVKELKITHEDIDASKSGRDTDTGIMKRTVVVKVHTLNVTLRRITQAEAFIIRNAVMNTENPFYYVKFRSPCAGNGELRRKQAYTSTINWGAQRYDRLNGRCFYDGVTFNIIETGEQS